MCVLGAQEGQQRVLHSQVLGLEMVVNHHQMLGIEHGSCTRVTGALGR